MVFYDSDFPRITISAKSKPQAYVLFKKQYGYSPKDLIEKPLLIKDNPLHITHAVTHEKSMGFSE